MKFCPLLPSLALLALLGSANHAVANIVITPAPGFSIGYNGNDGDFFDAGPTPTAPTNLASTSNGGTPFSSSDLGPELGIPFHRAVNLNDGLYSNSNSWISASGDGNPTAGVMLNGLYTITSIAWGRDNGNTTASDCCGGQATDRWPGIYELEFTNDGANWFSIGTIDYQSADDTVLGGAFTPWFRHEYTVASTTATPLTASGFRIGVPFAGIQANGTAIDEIEVYGVPEPTTALTLLAGSVGLLGRRRREIA